MSASNGARSEVPYKELDYFEETLHDQLSFAGRDRETREVASRIAVTRAFVLYGRSGLGKTSLLRAGVFPLLRQDGFLPIYIRTLEAPLDELAAALRDPRRAPMEPPAQPGESVDDLLQRAGGDLTPVLVFDQFEEFFTRFALRTDSYVAKRRDRTVFVNRICGLVLDQERDVRIVFSLREDYLHTLDAFQRKLPNLFSTAYRVLPLTAAGAREAIIKPLLRDEIEFSERLVSDLVNELAEFDFESARLQVACAEVYRVSAGAREGAKVMLREGDLRQIEDDGSAGLRGVFKRYLQAAVDALDQEKHLLARTLLDVLFAAKGTKYALLLRTLIDHRFGELRETCAVLRTLWRQKILRRQRLDGKTWFELRHECLVEPIEEWLNENEDFANYRQVRDIIKANARGGRFRQRTPMLLSHDQLDRLVKPNKERFRLEEIEVEFVLLSAIYDRSPDADWWARKFGEAKTEELIFDRLKTPGLVERKPDQTMLLGAATAAGAVPPRQGEIADCLLDLALDTSLREDVRRAAGRSLGTRAQDKQFDQIKKLMRPWHAPRAVRELLADLHDAKALTGRFNWWRRRQAKSRAEKRRIDFESRAIREAGGEGVSAGALGGLAWACSCGAIIICLFLNAAGGPSLAAWLIGVGIAAALASGAGALTGLVFARTAVTTKATHGSMDLERSVRNSKLCLTFFGAFALSLVPIVYERIEKITFPWEWLEITTHCVAYIALFFAGGVLGRRILSWAAPFPRLCMPDENRTSRLLWAIPPILLLTILLPGALFTMIGQKQLPEKEIVITMFVMFAIFAGFAGWMLMVATVSISAVDPAANSAPAADAAWRHTLARRIAGFGALLIVPWFLLTFGYDSLPLPNALLPIVEETAAGVIEWKPSVRVWPDTARALIKKPHLLYRVEQTPASASVSLDGDSLSSGEIVFIPLEQPVLTARTAQSSTPAGIGSLILKYKPLAPDGDIILNFGQPCFAAVELVHEMEPDPNNPGNKRDVWKGILHRDVHAPSATIDERLAVGFFRRALTAQAGNAEYFFKATENTQSDKTTERETLSAAGSLGQFGAPIEIIPDITRPFGPEPLDLWVRMTRINKPLLPQAAPKISMIVGLWIAPPQAVSSKVWQFKQEVENYPKRIELRNQLARALWKSAEYPEAKKVAEEAVALDGKSAEAWDNLAHIYYRIREFSKAVDAWEKALALDPEFHRHAPECADDLKRLEDARQKLQMPAAMPSPAK